MDYLKTADGGSDAPAEPGNGAGNNPSTWAGAIVLASVLVLIGMRASFRRFM